MAESEEEIEEEMDLETFISTYEIDESAAQALRNCPEDVLGRVMAQGPLTGANPSALIMSRIRNEAEGAADDPETFIAVCDDRAQKVFHEQSEAVKQLIMAEGALLGYNPSAILMGRLRKCKEAAKKSGGNPGLTTPQPGVKIIARKAAPAVAQRPDRPRPPAAGAVAEGAPDSATALHSLGVQLAQLNAAFWDFEVPRADLMTGMKEVLQTREAAVAVAWGEWSADAAGQSLGPPPRKKARPAVAGSNGRPPVGASDPELSDAEKDQKRLGVLDEVVRMLGDAGGQMPLQDIGSKHLTDLRKGAVGNLCKFLASRPDVVSVTAAESRDSSPIVTLL